MSLDTARGFLADASNAIDDTEADSVKGDAALHEISEAIDVAIRKIDALTAKIADNYDGPDDGDAWSGGFAANH
jgi:hypothetical protein